MTAAENGWTRVKFGGVVRNRTDAVPNPKAQGLDRTVGLDDLDGDSLAIRRFGTTQDGMTFTRRFDPGQVLFGKRRAYQRKVAVAEFSGVCSGDILVFEALPERLNPELLPFIVQSDRFFEHALRTSRGSLSPRTSWGDLAGFEFELPPWAEQRRIASLFWALEEAQREQAKLRETLDQLESVFASEQVCAVAYPRRPLRFAVHGITAGRSLVGTNTAATAGERGVLKVSAVGPAGFVRTENKKLLDQAEFRPEFLVHAGDFLVTRSNTRELVGRACIVPEDELDLMLSDKTLRLDLDAVNVEPAFLLAAFRTRELRIQIESRATGTGGAMKNLSQADFLSLQVPLPELKVQQVVVAGLASLTAAREAQRHNVEASRRLRHALTEELLVSPEPSA